MTTTNQRREVDRRVLWNAITAAEQPTENGMHRINWYAAIGLAFVLGIRFANKHPEAARDYMAKWLKDHKGFYDTLELAKRHELTVTHISNPLTEYLDEGT